jgi:hypothetical protein
MKTDEKNRLLRASEIGVSINTYDDIFSDFDPREYSERAVSQDFLEEARRASRDKREGIGLIFLAPKKIRDQKIESSIKKRLKEHFRRHTLEFRKEKLKIIREGILFFMLGIIFMIIATFLIAGQNSNFWITFLSILLEPGGWFLFWQGLELMIFEAREKTPELEFYRKMSRAEITFRDY